MSKKWNGSSVFRIVSADCHHKSTDAAITSVPLTAFNKIQFLDRTPQLLLLLGPPDGKETARHTAITRRFENSS
jgi:hypothetical protein